MALTLCLDCGLPTRGSRCTRCRNRRHNALYGRRHQAERVDWAYLVEAGHVTCAECGETIEPGSTWDLGHQGPGQRSKPEHADCNRSKGARHLR